MTECLATTLALIRWQGERGTYHLLAFTGEVAETLAMQANLHRLEFEKRRGFGSVKVVAKIRETEWKTSAFPQKKQLEWIVLVNRQVLLAEQLKAGNLVDVELMVLQPGHLHYIHNVEPSGMGTD